MPYINYDKNQNITGIFANQQYEGQKFIDTDSEEYKKYLLKQEKDKKTANLQTEIDELDKKRIRAIAEPSVKDEKTGQTWLEYYTDQVMELRNQIANLS